MARVAGVILAAASVAGLLAASTWSIRAGWADHLAAGQTQEGLEKASLWMPGHHEYPYRLALMTVDSDAARSAHALTRALELNPHDARAWIEMGLRREAEGSLVEAERSLLQAAAIDLQYVPAWTLANFYFRRGDSTRFWQWARTAALVVYSDGTELFRLCGRVVEDGELIDRLGIERPAVRVNYLTYLMYQRRTDLLMPATRKLLLGGDRAHDPLLMEACDRMLQARRVADALEIWNALAEKRRIPFARVALETPALVNATFSEPPTSHGFDWRMPGPEGVDVSLEEPSGGLRIALNGQQPEDCELLVQFVPVGENRIYEFRFTYQTTGVPAGSGLAWHVRDTNGGPALGDSGSLSSDDSKQGVMAFRTNASSQLARLALRYRRAPGTTRIAGFVVVRGVEIAPVEGPASRVMK